MKFRLINLLILFFPSFVFSQVNEAKFSNDFKLSFLDNSTSQIRSFDNHIIVNHKIGSFKEFHQNISLINLESGTVKYNDLGKMKVEDFVGYVAKSFENGEYIFQCIQLIHKSKPSNLSYVIQKRNIQATDKIEKELKIENWTTTTSVQPNGSQYHTAKIEVYSAENGFYVVRSSTVGNMGNENYVAFYNFELEEIWKNDFSFINQKGVSIDRTIVDAGNNLIVGLKIDDDNTKERWSFRTKLKKSGLVFYIVDEVGTDIVLSPEINQSLYPISYDLRYYNNKKQLVGLFQIRKMDEDKLISYGIGYAYMKWDIEGSILTSKQHFLKEEDLKSPDMDVFLSIYKQDYSVFIHPRGELKPLKNGYGHSYYFNETQDVIFAANEFSLISDDYKTFTLDFIKPCKLIFKVDSEGDLAWTKVITDIDSPYSCIKLFDNETYIFSTSYRENFEGGKYNIIKTKGKPGPADVLTIRKINNETGEIEYFDGILHNQRKNFVLETVYPQIDPLSKKVVFSYVNTKEKMIQFLTINQLE